MMFAFTFAPGSATPPSVSPPTVEPAGSSIAPPLFVIAAPSTHTPFLT